MAGEWVVTAVEETAGEMQQILFGGTPVGPPGYLIRVVWAGAAGATAAEVTQAQVVITPLEIDENLGDLTMQIGSGGEFAEITVPAGKRISALNLQGLKNSDGTLLTSRSEVDAAGLRLVTTIKPPGGTFGAPLYAEPPCPKRGMLPQTLTGASYSSGQLYFSQPLTADKIRLSLASGSFPEEFDSQPISLTKVSGVAAAAPRDLTLTDPSGGVVWSFPGDMPAGVPPATADLRLPLETAIAAALKSGVALDFSFKLQAAAASNAFVNVSKASGFLVRTSPGILKTTLEGEPIRVPLDGPAPAAELPYSATAGLTVRYLGMRILESVSDPFPAPNSAIAGTVIQDQAVLRAFPAGSLGDLPVARIGLVGRAPEEVELVVQPVDLSSGPPGIPTGPPGVRKLSPTDAVHLEWVDLPQPAVYSGTPGLAVRTTLGRFFWACGEQPLVRIAVIDPDPGGRSLRLDGQTLLAMDQVEANHAEFSLPTAVFQGSLPSWESELFLKVDLSDLTLRYGR